MQAYSEVPPPMYGNTCLGKLKLFHGQDKVLDKKEGEFQRVAWVPYMQFIILISSFQIMSIINH